MAYNKDAHSYDVQPIEADGALTGVRITHEKRTVRLSESGSILDYGYSTRAVVAEIEVPINKLSDLVRELTDWPIWYATTPKEER